MTKAEKLPAAQEGPEQLELPAASLGLSPGTFSTRSPLPQGWGARGVQTLLSNLKVNQVLAGFLNPRSITAGMPNSCAVPEQEVRSPFAFCLGKKQRERCRFQIIFRGLAVQALPTPAPGELQARGSQHRRAQQLHLHGRMLDGITQHFMVLRTAPLPAARTAPAEACSKLFTSLAFITANFQRQQRPPDHLIFETARGQEVKYKHCQDSLVLAV